MKTESFLSPVKLLTASLSLPEGHVGKKFAQDLVDKEYALATEYEKTIHARLSKRKDLPLFLSKVETAFEISNAICDFWNIRRVKAFVFRSADVDVSASAHYWQREIHFATSYFTITVLLHELAHHFARMDKNNCGHGKDFIMYESMVSDTFFNLF